MQWDTQKKQDRGISLLIVLLVGSIMLAVSVSVGALALRSVQTADVRATSLAMQYMAQDAFACVRANIDKDYEAFTNASGVVTCGGQDFDFVAKTPVGTNYTTGGGKGTSQFTIPNAGGNGGVVVQIVRDLGIYHFRGTTTVSAYSGDASSPKTVQRLQEYFYEGFLGADIMFVIDRSGSIAGGRNIATAPAPFNGPVLATEDWGRLMYALADSVALLKTKVPEPKIGVLSFGYEPGETGVWQAPAFCGGVQCVVEPDIALADKNSTTLPTNGGSNQSPGDDSLGTMKTAVSYTNMSLGLSIAGAELMGKYYPYGIARGTTGVPDAYATGGFEKLVADGNSLTQLRDQTTPRDRNDVEFPDYIIVITDGEPNSIIRHTTDAQRCYNTNVVSGNLGFRVDGTAGYPVTNVPGQGMLFGTRDSASDTGCLTDSVIYHYCNDRGTSQPSTVLGFDRTGVLYGNGEIPNQAMCNATLIARALESNGVKVAVIGVGETLDLDAEYWMQNILASEGNDGQPLYKRVESYTDLANAIQFILGKLSMVQSL